MTPKTTAATTAKPTRPPLEDARFASLLGAGGDPVSFFAGVEAEPVAESISASRRSISSLMSPSCPWIGVIHNRGHAKGPDAFASGPFKDWEKTSDHADVVSLRTLGALNDVKLNGLVLV